MLERVGTAVAILTGWRHSGSHPRERMDGTRFSLEINKINIFDKIKLTINLIFANQSTINLRFFSNICYSHQYYHGLALV